MKVRGLNLRLLRSRNLNRFPPPCSWDKSILEGRRIKLMYKLTRSSIYTVVVRRPGSDFLNTGNKFRLEYIHDCEREYLVVVAWLGGYHTPAQGYGGSPDGHLSIAELMLPDEESF